VSQRLVPSVYEALRMCGMIPGFTAMFLFRVILSEHIIILYLTTYVSLNTKDVLILPSSLP
jgi:hypothetical protein